MDTALQTKVASVAKRVRTWTKERAKKANYNPHDLTGWCAISAAYLFRELQKEGIESSIHVKDYENCHCFVVVDDYVVDVTATQFSEFRNNPIVIMHIKEAEAYSFYATEKVFKFPDELRAHQLRTKWPKRQIAYTR